EGKPIQVVAASLAVTFPLIDLSDAPEPKQSALTRALINEEAMRPFDLAECPLIGQCLIRLDEETHVCLLTMHHIISDGWSTGMVVRELSLLYEAFATGRLSPLPELPLQYTDYACWQRDWLQGKELEEHLYYWKQQ